MRILLTPLVFPVQAVEAPWRVERQKLQQERRESQQRRQQTRFRSTQRRLFQQPAGGVGSSNDASSGSNGSSVVWRQRAHGGTVTVRVGRLKAQRPVRLSAALTNGSSKARSSSSSSNGGSTGGSSGDGGGDEAGSSSDAK
jgi:hypothetical protein